QLRTSREDLSGDDSNVLVVISFGRGYHDDPPVNELGGEPLGQGVVQRVELVDGDRWFQDRHDQPSFEAMLSLPSTMYTVRIPGECGAHRGICSPRHHSPTSPQPVI